MTLGPAEVRAITGHKTLVMLSRYTHLRGADLVAKVSASAVRERPTRRGAPAPGLEKFRRRA